MRNEAKDVKKVRTHILSIRIELELYLELLRLAKIYDVSISKIARGYLCSRIERNIESPMGHYRPNKRLKSTNL